MNLSVEEIRQDGLTRQLRITVPGEEITKRLDEAMRKLMPKVDLKGFRKGHVPLEQIKQRYGEELLQDIVRDLISETSRKALDDKKFDAVAQPAARLESELAAMMDGADLNYQMTLEVNPEFTLIDVSTLELERITAELSEEDVTAALQNLSERNRVFEDKDAARPAQKGDMLIVDLTGTIDGQPFKDNENKDMRVVLGEGQLAESFEKALPGKETGSSFNVPMGFAPDHPNKELAGKLADFAVAVKAIHAPRSTQIDDVFAKAMGADNVEALRQNVRNEMQRADQDSARQHLKQQISQAMLKHEFDLPQSLVAREKDILLQQVEAMKAQMQKQAQQIPDDQKPDFNKLEQNVKIMAEKRVRVALVLSRVAREKKIEVSDEILRQAVEEDIRRYPGKPEQIRKIYQEHPELVQRLYAQLLEEKTIDEIIKTAKISEKKMPRKELYQEDDKQSLTDGVK